VRRRPVLALAVLALAGAPAVASPAPAAPAAEQAVAVREWSPQRAYAAWRAGRIAIIDVREPSEHRENRVRGVPLIPLAQVPRRLGSITRAKPVVVLCRTGRRARVAAEYLASRGYRGTGIVQGGIVAWAAAGLPYQGVSPA
jgi:rhodanese-related sulfurtransferase